VSRPTPRAREWVDEDPLVLEARTQLEITRAETERDELDRQLRAGQRQAERLQEAEQRQKAEVARLDGLKAYGRSLGTDLPVAWFSELTSDLERFVNATNTPASLPERQVEALVASRVDRIRERCRAEESARLKGLLDSMKVRGLIAYGQRHVSLRTLFWDSSDAEIACSRVRRELRSQVESDWTEADVRALVEDVLSDWGDEEEPDEVGEDEDVPEDEDCYEED
jgi:hypothetical protein